MATQAAHVLSRTHQLLNLAFLERRVLARARLHVKPTSTLVLFANLTDAFREGHDCALEDDLEDFVATRVAGVCVDFDKGLDF